MEDIEAEIQEKVIEKVVDIVEKQPEPEPELKPVKQKKPRTEAQKAAFEKARAKRMENLKKKQAAPNGADGGVATHSGGVEDKPATAPKRRGRPRGVKVKEEIPVRPEPVNHPVYQPVNHGIPFNQNIPQNYYSYDPRAFPPPAQLPPQPQPVNNYYYYGAPPPTPQHRDLPQQELKPVALIEDSSSEEEEEYYEYQNPEYIQEPPQPKLKFRFA